MKNLERTALELFSDYRKASVAAAERITALIQKHNYTAKATVLGLATGSTPIALYRELIRRHKEDGLDFSRVITFNLDEYWPIQPDAPQSYHRYMQENLFKHLNIIPENIHILNGMVSEEELENYCRLYEENIEAVGGIDIQILGIGRTGHIGFNEPGSGRDSKTRRVRLDKITRLDAVSDFQGEANVPHYAITMGIGTILKASTILLLAFGEHKAPIVRRTIEEPPSNQVAASYLQDHPSVSIYLDPAAASLLTRESEPWKVTRCKWDDKLVRKAVTGLALKLDKPVLELTDADYVDNDLYDLLNEHGGSYDVNLKVFRRMMKTISGWPGGKGAARTVCIFSPHPDDDVISMGATMQRLCSQGHEVHCIYMTSGASDVADHSALQYADFAAEFNRIFGLAVAETSRIDEHIEAFLRRKTPGLPDSDEVLAVKTLIRKTEALAASSYCGVLPENCHFISMPFARIHGSEPVPPAPEDTDLLTQMLQRIRPAILFAPGENTNPQGVHRRCLDAIQAAVRQYCCKLPAPCCYFYRGSWQEWEPCRIDLAIPISPDELLQKRHAILRHQTQLGQPAFPGSYDIRELWQRAEERNRETAATYDRLGLPKYHGMEAFILWDPESDSN
jgi:glucosamine-6-phosphate deaminase